MEFHAISLKEITWLFFEWLFARALVLKNHIFTNPDFMTNRYTNSMYIFVQVLCASFLRARVLKIFVWQAQRAQGKAPNICLKSIIAVVRIETFEQLQLRQSFPRAKPCRKIWQISAALFLRNAPKKIFNPSFWWTSCSQIWSNFRSLF